MKIEFYHVDAFEVANYEPIWRELKRKGVETNLVAVPGHQNTAAANWFDYATFQAYCESRQLPFTDKPDCTATMGVTTQNADILANYAYRVRLMYGPVIFPAAWALQAHAVKPFDVVLTHGRAYQERFMQWLTPEQLPIIGYPRYDDFFAGKLSRQKIREAWGLNEHRPVLAFLPTWDNNTGLDAFLPYLLQLADQYQIILRPHHCTVRFEPERMEKLKASGLLLLENAYDLAEVYAASDVVVSDVRSGGLFEACLCDIPTVGMVIDPHEITGWLSHYHVDSMVSLCYQPDQLRQAIDIALTSSTHAEHRKLWADQHVAFRDGTAAKEAAEALIQLADKRLCKPVFSSAGLTSISMTATNLNNN